VAGGYASDQHAPGAVAPRIVSGFLIDECLSPRLAQMACKAGFPQSTCVRDRGWQGEPDWRITQRAVDGDFILVTHNSTDFRGAGAAKPGGHYAKLELHAGLVCLAVPVLDLALQEALFAAVLDDVRANGELVNQVLEVTVEGDEIILTRWPLPA
jgi:hypothetical protein